jgi:lipopolysaccharide export system protein LptA
MTTACRWRGAIILGLSLLFATDLAAQTATGVPNALQGFSQNRNEPVQIEAASLEVRDKDKVATFSGNVRVTQGDTTLRSKSLLVFYDQEDKPSNMKAAQPGPGGQQQIRKLEARGGVVVTQKDQTATGDTASFDMRTNTVTLHGNVVVTQGQNVLRGDRLVVDLTSGISRVESGKGRVQGLFLPNSGPETKPEKSASPQGRPAPKSQPPHPSGLY